MQKENKIFIYSIAISFLLHILFVNILPGIKKIEIKETKKEVVSIPMKFVKLPKKQIKEVKVKKNKKVQKIKVEKSGNDLKERKPLKQESVGNEIKYQDSFPEIEMPIKNIEFEGKKKSLDWENEDLRIKKDLKKEKYEGEMPQLKKIRQDEKNEFEEKIPVKISEKINEDLAEEVTPKFSQFEEIGGIVEIEFPEGVEKIEVEGKGKIGRIKAKKIKYPESAQKNGWEGKVELRLDIDNKGNVESVIVERKSLYFILTDSAKSQIKDWNIQIINNGMQIGGIVMITINFELIKGRE
ncbi:MAG: hypothetical protein B6I28_05690 [Fusobacteriia bacterium 4572_132]|nr:MAG: hypothetical protein B6I28_05690 [Fusobacteriia bacterium 4572_132]